MELRTSDIAINTYKHVSRFFIFLFGPKFFKGFNEISFWLIRKLKEGKLTNHHYEAFYTSFFGLEYSFYKNKKVLDVGCGPRGSLEWANNTSERIGLDPLAHQYLKMQGKHHKMQYIKGGAEAIPFEAGYFDVVTSFNSLDHVDDLTQCITEIKRVVKPGGLFLLIADIHAFPTITEPSGFGWDIIKSFESDFEVTEELHFEGSNMYKSLRERKMFDHSDNKNRYGIITLKLKRL